MRHSCRHSNPGHEEFECKFHNKFTSFCNKTCCSQIDTSFRHTLYEGFSYENAWRSWVVDSDAYIVAMRRPAQLEVVLEANANLLARILLIISLRWKNKSVISFGTNMSLGTGGVKIMFTSCKQFVFIDIFVSTLRWNRIVILESDPTQQKTPNCCYPFSTTFLLTDGIKCDMPTIKRKN